MLAPRPPCGGEFTRRPLPSPAVPARRPTSPATPSTSPATPSTRERRHAGRRAAGAPFHVCPPTRFGRVAPPAAEGGRDGHSDVHSPGGPARRRLTRRSDVGQLDVLLVAGSQSGSRVQHLGAELSAEVAPPAAEGGRDGHSDVHLPGGPARRRLTRRSDVGQLHVLLVAGSQSGSRVQHLGAELSAEVAPPAAEGGRDGHSDVHLPGGPARRRLTRSSDVGQLHVLLVAGSQSAYRVQHLGHASVVHTPGYDGLPGMRFPAPLVVPDEGQDGRLPGGVRPPLRPAGVAGHPCREAVRGPRPGRDRAFGHAAVGGAGTDAEYVAAQIVKRSADSGAAAEPHRLRPVP